MQTTVSMNILCLNKFEQQDNQIVSNLPSYLFLTYMTLIGNAQFFLSECNAFAKMVQNDHIHNPTQQWIYLIFTHPLAQGIEQEITPMN